MPVINCKVGCILCPPQRLLLHSIALLAIATSLANDVSAFSLNLHQHVNTDLVLAQALVCCKCDLLKLMHFGTLLADKFAGKARTEAECKM